MSELLVKLLGLTREKLQVMPEDLPITLNYYERLQRFAVEVESEARLTAVPCLQGRKYVGLGTQVIEERRLSQR
jgi:hypothetical protein